MRDALIHRYLTKDIRLSNPEDNDKDWINTFPNPFELVGNKEFSMCNQAALTEEFLKVKDQTKVIVEIGVSRLTNIQSYEQTSTSIFLNYKNPETIYLGIDIDDKSFLKGPNVHTLQAKSEDYTTVLNKFKSLGIYNIDFLFVDGWHSINQVIDELWYVDFMESGGVVGYHDTNFHPGPRRIINALRPTIFNTTKCCTQQNDWGVGFAKIK